jgi:hypothetical protein
MLAVFATYLARRRNRHFFLLTRGAARTALRRVADPMDPRRW